MSENTNSSTALAVRDTRDVAVRDDGEPRAIVPRTFSETIAMSDALSKSGLVPTAMRSKAADVMLVIMAGAEMGLAPITSLHSFHVIEGAAKMSAETLRGIVLASPTCEYLDLVEFTDNAVTWEGKRRGRPAVRVQWTMAQAKTAQLAGRANWQKFQRAMLSARASGDICRAIWPDVCKGIKTVEEYDDGSAIGAAGISSGFVAPDPATAAPVAIAATASATAAATAKEAKAKAKADKEAADAKAKAEADAKAKEAPPAAPPAPGVATSPPAAVVDAEVVSETRDPAPALEIVKPFVPADDWGDAPAAPVWTIDEFKRLCAAAATVDALMTLKDQWLPWSKADGFAHAGAMRTAFAERKAALS